MRCERIAPKPPLIMTTGRIISQPITERSSSTWNTPRTCVVSRPATDIARNEAIDRAIQRAALAREGCVDMAAYVAEVMQLYIRSQRQLHGHAVFSED